MGARQSRRSVDITTTPKKEGLPAEGGVGDAAAPGDGKLERIEETDTKPTTNGIAPHTDVAEDKDKDKDDATEKEKDKEKQEEVKVEETISAAESPTETAEVTTPTEANPASPNTATSPDNKETKKKEKMKKKWSFRSISFSKKDKNKPAREEAPKNGDVTKEEPLAEGGEEAENGSPTAGSPVEEKSAVSSPTAENEEAAAPVATATAAAASAPAAATAATAVAAAAATSAVAAAAAAAAAAPTAESKEETAASAASSPAEEKTEEPTPSAPTPVPVEEKKEEVEKVEAEKKVVEVSPAGGQFVPDPVEVSVFRVQTVATTPSIIERKTSEDIPSLPPSSPPPTPIDSSPLQQAQQAAAATATALAEALKLPAEAAHNRLIPTPAALSSLCPEQNHPSIPAAESLDTTPQRPPSSPVHQQPTLEPPSAEALPVVDTDATEPPTAKHPQTHSDQPPSEFSNLFGQQLLAAFPDQSSESDASFPEKPLENNLGSAEKAVESRSTDDRVCDPIDARASEGDACQIILESTTKKETVERESTDVPEPVDAKTRPKEELLVEEIIEPNEVVQEEIERVEEAVVDPPPPPPPVSTIDAIVESEEGPIPASDETLVEAKPAVVIPEDEDASEGTVENAMDVTAKLEDKLETETESDVAVPTEEILLCEVVAKESKDPFVPNEATFAADRPIHETVDVPESSRSEEESTTTMPPPLPDSPVPSSREKFHSESVNLALDSNAVPSPVIHLEPSLPSTLLDVEKNTGEVDGCPLSLPGQQTTPPDDCSHADLSVPLADHVSLITLNVSESSLVEENVPSSRLEEEHLPEDHRETQRHTDSPQYPKPPEELSCPLDVSERNSDEQLPVPDESAASLRDPTETTLPISPRTPSPLSNVSITSGLTTSTKDSSQTLLYDDQSNREFKMESVSISLNSYNESDIELKERLAESLAETEKQEESSVSCQLSNNATSSTTIQETHQSTPEPEAPVENNVAADTTTESSGEAIVKVTTPAVPSEVPATVVPSSPAITEDVASVAMAIGKMNISDKAIAAATIECNTNEIIAEACYQYDMNE